MRSRIPIAIVFVLAAASACAASPEEECEISPADSLCSDPAEIVAETGEGTASFAMPSGDDVIPACQEPSCVEIAFDLGVFTVDGDAPSSASDIRSIYERVETLDGWRQGEGVETLEHQAPTLYCIRQAAQAQTACVFAPADAPSFVFTLAAEGPNTPRLRTADDSALLVADVTE